MEKKMKFETLRDAGLLGAMSAEGRELVLPQGIFYWSGRAKQEAEINATIGSAQGKSSEFLEGGGDDVRTFYLPSVVKHLKALDPEKIAPYAPICGLPRYRVAWREWIIRKLSPFYKFDSALIGQPIVSPGVTSGLAYVARLFASPGDTIVCHDRRWENYDLVLSDMLGLKIRAARLFNEAGSGLDVDSFVDAVRETAKTQDVVAILNFPNNPTGYMPTVDEGLALQKALLKVADESGKKLILVFDDAYDGFVYEKNAEQISLFGHFIGAHPNILPVKCDGASKEFLFYGARVGSVTFAYHPSWGEPAKLSAEFDNKVGALIRGTISNSNLAFQHAVAAAIESGVECDSERARVISVLAERYSIIKSAMASNLPESAVADPFNSGFFCFINLNPPAEDFADKLLKNRKLGVIPLSDSSTGFNGIRVAFCSVEAKDIPETIDRIVAELDK